jgi:hypothetical protein
VVISVIPPLSEPNGNELSEEESVSLPSKVGNEDQRNKLNSLKMKVGFRYDLWRYNPLHGFHEEAEKCKLEQVIMQMWIKIDGNVVVVDRKELPFIPSFNAKRRWGVGGIIRFIMECNGVGRKH